MEWLLFLEIIQRIEEVLEATNLSETPDNLPEEMPMDSVPV